MSTSAQNQSIENVSIPDVLNAGISFLSWTLLISSAATWAMPLISESTNG